MGNETYKGWPNFETWCTDHWLRRIEGAVPLYFALAKLLLSENERGIAINKLGSDMKEHQMKDVASVFSDSLGKSLLDNSFSKVDWYRIAEGFMEEVK